MIRELTDNWLGARLATPKTSQTDSDQILNTAPALATALRTQQIARDIRDIKEDKNRAVQIGTRRLTEARDKLQGSTRNMAGTKPGLQTANLKELTAIKESYDNMRIGATLFTNLAALSGDPQVPRAGAVLGRTSHAVINVSEAVELFNKNGISTLAMASTGVGAALTIVQAFQGPQEDPVAQQLQAIQRQITELRDEMRKHFSLVNEKLAAVLEISSRSLACAVPH